MAFTEGFWFEGLKGTVQRMQDCLLGWGPKADFPSAVAGNKGKLAWATDEKIVYYGDGSSWVAMGPNVPAMARVFPASGRYYGSLNIVPTLTSLAITANRLYAIPFIVGRTATFDRLCIYVTGTGAGNARLGIYESTDGAPGALVDDSGTVSVSSTGSKEITINQQLTMGVLYWLAVVSDVAPTLLAFLETEALTGIAGAVATDDAFDFTFAYKAFTYATLPDPWGTPTWAAGKVPHLTLRRT